MKEFLKNLFRAKGETTGNQYLRKQISAAHEKCKTEKKNERFSRSVLDDRKRSFYK